MIGTRGYASVVTLSVVLMFAFASPAEAGRAGPVGHWPRWTAAARRRSGRLGLRLAELLLADLFADEKTYNPDKVQTYGFSGLSPTCAATIPPGIPTDPYDGVLDTHPYAVAIVPGGWVVADAAANDLLMVSSNGSIRTLRVLPGQPGPITAQNDTFNGLPVCAIGAVYTAEPVPTDVEVGPDEVLYASTLSGDPAPGNIYRVNPTTCAATKIASSFAAATNLRLLRTAPATSPSFSAARPVAARSRRSWARPWARLAARS